MSAIKKPFSADHAKVYDQKAQAAGWIDPDILFGLAYRFIKPDDTILDLGIGTGLSSTLFHKAGLLVHGMDLSPAMLAVCESKKMTVDLKAHDLTQVPYPYDSGSLQHGICTGVFHIFSDLTLIFNEMSRILKPQGIFAFVVAHREDDEACAKTIENKRGQSGKMTLHRHSRAVIEGLLDFCGFSLLRQLDYSAASIGGNPVPYRACVVQKD